MSRTNRFEAVILKARRFGEIHKSVTMLSPQEGLVSAIAYGAHSQKGRLRGAVDPFHRGICYLYTNPVKDQHKVTDFDVQSYYSGLRERIDRFYAASLWAEVLLKSYAGGNEAGPVYELLTAGLSVLEGAESQNAARRATAQFLWRYFVRIGSNPELDRCLGCGREIGAEEVRRYRPFASGVVCLDCAGEEGMRLSPGAVRYVSETATRPFAEAAEIGLAAGALSELTGFLFSLAEGVLEQRLNTLKTGRGIL
jgi:DNA repair protein RecO (recombination protein O)